MNTLRALKCWFLRLGWCLVFLQVGLSVPSVKAQNSQGAYPNRPITLISPTGREGDGATVAQLFANALAKALGVSVKLSFTEVAQVQETLKQFKNQTPDGYTLMLGGVGSLIMPYVVSEGMEPMWQHFHYIDFVSFQPLICVTGQKSTIKDFNDLIERVRLAPKNIRHTTFGSRSAMLFPSYFLRTVGVRYDQISVVVANPNDPERRSPVSILEEGKADFSCATPGYFVPAIREKRVRPIFSNSLTMAPELIGANYGNRSNQKGLDRFQIWTVLMTPKNIKPEVDKKLHDAIKQIANDPEWRDAEINRFGMMGVGRIAKPVEYIKQEAAFYENTAILLRLVK